MFELLFALVIAVGIIGLAAGAGILLGKILVLIDSLLARFFGDDKAYQILATLMIIFITSLMWYCIYFMRVEYKEYKESEQNKVIECLCENCECTEPQN
jgi:uncharacterized PurR-regulated membrane protein YhhQ (DUF165 family)